MTKQNAPLVLATAPGKRTRAAAAARAARNAVAAPRPVGRPRSANPRIPVGLRLDPVLRAELVRAAEARGIGYQTLISRVLQSWIENTAWKTEELETRRIK